MGFPPLGSLEEARWSSWPLAVFLQRVEGRGHPDGPLHRFSSCGGGSAQ